MQLEEQRSRAPALEDGPAQGQQYNSADPQVGAGQPGSTWKGSLSFQMPKVSFICTDEKNAVTFAHHLQASPAVANISRKKPGPRAPQCIAIHAIQTVVPDSSLYKCCCCGLTFIIFFAGGYRARAALRQRAFGRLWADPQGQGHSAPTAGGTGPHQAHGHQQIAHQEHPQRQVSRH